MTILQDITILIRPESNSNPWIRYLKSGTIFLGNIIVFSYFNGCLDNDNSTLHCVTAILYFIMQNISSIKYQQKHTFYEIILCWAISSRNLYFQENKLLLLDAQSYKVKLWCFYWHTTYLVLSAVKVEVVSAKLQHFFFYTHLQKFYTTVYAPI